MPDQDYLLLLTGRTVAFDMLLRALCKMGCRNRRPSRVHHAYVPDRPEIREIQDRILGKIRHVVDDAVGLVAIVPSDRGNAAVFDPTSHLHFTGDNVVFTGS